MLERIKEEVLQANLALPKNKLVTFTWGNVSGISRKDNLIVIKPSGIPYKELMLDHLVIIDLEGNVVEGDLNPSSDTATHLVLYKNFPNIGGVVHTHAPWATSWAQSGRDIPVLGTTHGDYFYGPIPCTRSMTKAEIEDNYEHETGKVIVETFKDKINENQVPSVLVYGHGPFSWGESALEAVHNAIVLEEISKTSLQTIQLNPHIHEIDQTLLNKHYLRKHGASAYYGQ